MKERIIKERNLDGEIIERLPQDIIDDYKKQQDIIDDLKWRLYEICKANWKNSIMTVTEDIEEYIPEEIKNKVIDEIETEKEAYDHVILSE